MGLLDMLGGNRAQMPGQSRGGFGQLLDPSVALPMAAALMGNQGNMQNFGNAFGQAGPALAQTRDNNKTYQWLQQNAPEYAQLMDGGADGQSVLALYAKNRFAEPTQGTDDMREYEFAKQQGFGGSFLDYQMNNRQASGNATPDSRAASAQQFGLSQDDPAYRSYVLTGKMPREDQAPLTATDKKAILEADDMIMANQEAVRALDSVLAEPNGPGSSLNDRAGSGALSGTQSWLARNDPTGFFDDGQGQATTELSNVVLGQALSSLKSIFGAAPTEGERKILVDLQASIDKTPSERRTILQRAKALAERRLEFNRQRAGQLRNEEYYRPGGQQSMTPPSGSGFRILSVE
jgi:hypothetical protein